MKINLLKRKPKRLKRVGNKTEMENKVWYIAIKHNNTTYYVQEVDKQNGAVKWTTHRSRAMQFHTENGVHHFIHAYMNDRHDIYLIHAEGEEI